MKLLGLIEDYRQGLRNSIVRHPMLAAEAAPPEVAAASAKARPQGAALNRCPVPEWVHQQSYVRPYPKELMLRNHV